MLQKGGNNTHLVVIIRVRLSQKIGLLDLTNWNQYQKRKTAGNNVHIFCVITEELVPYYICRIITKGTQISTSWGCGMWKTRTHRAV